MVGIFPIIFIAEMDYVALTFKFWFPLDQRSEFEHLALRTISSILFEIAAIECVRTFRYLVVYAVVMMKATGILVTHIRNEVESNAYSAIQNYRTLYQIHNVCIEPMSSVAFVGIHGAQFMAVFALAGTVLGWKFLSPNAYWLFPLLAILTMIILDTILPIAVFSVEESNATIRELRCKCRGNLSRRIFKTLRTIGFSVEGLGMITPAFKSHFFSVIIFNTQDIIIMTMSLL